MKVITLVSAKGGSGKSTAVRGLVGAAAQAGIDVGFIDTDRNANVVGWAQDGARAGNWSGAIQAFRETEAERIADLLADMEADEDPEDPAPDLLVVDSPGAASDVHEVLMQASDLILTPLVLTAQSVATAARTASFFHQLGSDPRVERLAAYRCYLSMLPRSLTGANKDMRARVESENLIWDREGRGVARMPLMRTALRQRDAYARMEAEGLLHLVAEAARQSPAKRIQYPRLMDGAEEMTAFLGECLDVIGDEEAAAMRARLDLSVPAELVA